MPIYEYRCEACGHEHDALQKISDPLLTVCPECAEPALKRLISAPSFRLKGSGWYETDFKSEKEKKRNLAETGDAAKGDKKSDADSKPKDSGKTDSKASESKPSEPKKPKETGPKKAGSGNEAA